MADSKKQTLFRIACILVLVAFIVMATVTFESHHTKAKIQDTLTELCTESMVNITLNLRQGDEISPEYFYRFHEITQVFPDTYYSVLSETLLPLTDLELSQQLTQSQRNDLADLIARTSDESMQKEEWEPIIYDIENILATLH